MAAITPSAGYNLGVSYTPSGGSATVLKVTGWDFGEINNTNIVTHTGTAGLQARIAGITDLNGNVTATVDTTLYPFATTTPLIRAGGKGTITFTLNSTGPDTIAFTVIIARVNFSSRVDGVLTYNFDVELDNLAEAASLTTYPT